MDKNKSAVEPDKNNVCQESVKKTRVSILHSGRNECFLLSL